jgi:hypothetical protein
MLENFTIKDFNGSVFESKDFYGEIDKHNKEGFNIYVGTDSKVYKDQIFLVTVICFHKDGSSGKVFYIREFLQRKLYPSLRARMLLEANRSVEVAMDLEPLCKRKIEVHLDIGDTIKSKTSAYEKELQSLVVSQGYVCEIKPNSWASSSVADKVTR